ncbi:hypothetical protein DL95DRAFT_387790, partial [Leptodontidium sp. 2 PMI_412]
MDLDIPLDLDMIQHSTVRYSSMARRGKQGTTSPQGQGEDPDLLQGGGGRGMDPVSCMEG